MAKRHVPPAHPQAPVDLIAVAVGCCEVILAWTGSGADERCRIERAERVGPPDSFVEIGGVGPHVAAFRDGSVKPHTTYAYRVYAWNSTGDSLPSNVTQVRTPQAGRETAADTE